MEDLRHVLTIFRYKYRGHRQEFRYGFQSARSNHDNSIFDGSLAYDGVRFRIRWRLQTFYGLYDFLQVGFIVVGIRLLQKHKPIALKLFENSYYGKKQDGITSQKTYKYYETMLLSKMLS